MTIKQITVLNGITIALDAQGKAYTLRVEPYSNNGNPKYSWIEIEIEEPKEKLRK